MEDVLFVTFKLLFSCSLLFNLEWYSFFFCAKDQTQVLTCCEQVIFYLVASWLFNSELKGNT